MNKENKQTLRINHGLESWTLFHLQRPTEQTFKKDSYQPIRQVSTTNWLGIGS